MESIDIQKKISLVLPKIVLFGDSNVQRSFSPDLGPWGASVANRFQRIVDVVCRGFSGYTSRSGRIVLPRLFYPENISGVEAFVIFFGTNDSSGKVDAPEYHVPIEEYIENLEEMIQYLQEIGLSKDKIIFIAPGPFHSEKFLQWCQEAGRTFPTKEDALVCEYAKACVSVAKKHDLEFINLYEEMKKDEDWPKFLVDGVHVSPEGATLIYKLLRPILDKKIDPSEIFFPYWQDINSIKPDDKEAENICYKKSKNVLLELTA